MLDSNVRWYSELRNRWSRQSPKVRMQSQESDRVTLVVLILKKAQILFLLCIRSVCIHLDKLEGQLNKIHNTQKWIEMRKNMNKSSDYCDTYLLNNICRCFITRILNLIVIEFKAHFSKATHIWILYSPVLFFTVNIQIKCTRKVNS